jgi:hypothetical protein
MPIPAIERERDSCRPRFSRWLSKGGVGSAGASPSLDQTESSDMRLRLSPRALRRKAPSASRTRPQSNVPRMAQAEPIYLYLIRLGGNPGSAMMDMIRPNSPNP